MGEIKYLKDTLAKAKEVHIYTFPTIQKSISPLNKRAISVQSTDFYYVVIL